MGIGSPSSVVYAFSTEFYNFNCILGGFMFAVLQISNEW